MFKFIIPAVVGFSLFGCASSSSVKELQAQVDAHVSADASMQKTQAEKDAAQDAGLAELNTRVDRAFVKK